MLRETNKQTNKQTNVTIQSLCSHTHTQVFLYTKNRNTKTFLKKNRVGNPNGRQIGSKCFYTDNNKIIQNMTSQKCTEKKGSKINSLYKYHINNINISMALYRPYIYIYVLCDVKHDKKRHMFGHVQ